jgi:hypothetical protein
MKAAPRNVRPLWLGLFAGPAGLLVAQQGAYALAPRACETGNTAPLQAMALAGLIVVGLGAWLAWRGWWDTGAGGPTDTADPKLARARFLSLLGLLSAPLFALLIVSQWVTIAVLDPCGQP